MDAKGTKAARNYISMIKVAAPRVALKVIDDAIQIHGAHGVSQDSMLSAMYSGMRTLRVADGPDVVHLNTVAKSEAQLQSPVGPIVSGAPVKRDVHTAFPPAKL
jgi:acyl-CoA dehydrogenase